MKKKLPWLVTVVISVIFSILFTNVLLFAGEQGGGRISIMATVRPQRTIIVDNNLTVQKILSNTKHDMRPIVVLGSEDGPELPFSESIIAQYQQLKPSLNFAKPGIVYIREDRALQVPFVWAGRIFARLFSF